MTWVALSDLIHNLADRLYVCKRGSSTSYISLDALPDELLVEILRHATWVPYDIAPSDLVAKRLQSAPARKQQRDYMQSLASVIWSRIISTSETLPGDETVCGSSVQEMVSTGIYILVRVGIRGQTEEPSRTHTVHRTTCFKRTSKSYLDWLVHKTTGHQYPLGGWWNTRSQHRTASPPPCTEFGQSWSVRG